MTDVRTAEIVESIEADFSTKRWTVAPLSDSYHVGAGLYLIVPIADALQGEMLLGRVMNWKEAL
jgi:hypothetical protein